MLPRDLFACALSAARLILFHPFDCCATADALVDDRTAAVAVPSTGGDAGSRASFTEGADPFPQRDVHFAPEGSSEGGDPVD